MSEEKMKPIIEHFEDKSTWASGPWKTEPDKMEWRYRGVPCLIVRNSSGALCGYAAVESKHPLYGKEYSICIQGCKDYCYEHSPESILDVHGGLTYSGFCQEGGKICHVAQPGEEDKAWWFGFDCAHSGDCSPKYIGTERGQFLSDGVYRNIYYVERQVEKLADQLIAISEEKDFKK